MENPREWVIWWGQEVVGPGIGFDEGVKVIEKSYADKLESQIAELNKNCISLNLHESRMKKAEQMYHEMELLYLKEKESSKEIQARLNSLVEHMSKITDENLKYKSALEAIANDNSPPWDGTDLRIVARDAL